MGNGKKKPFWKVVLERMEISIPHILGSCGAESDLRKYGNILRDSDLSEMKKGELVEIFSRINIMMNKISPEGDTARAHKYLKVLVKKIKQTP